MNTTVAEQVPFREDERSILAEDRLYTSEEFLEISKDTSRVYELKKGKLTIMSPAGRNHGKLALRIGARIQVFVDEDDLGEAYAAETGFKLETDPDTVLAPDVSFVNKERLPAGEMTAGFLPGPPDLAVEVVSPGDRASEVQSKVQQWLTHGTKLVWIVEPDSQTVNVYRSDGSAALLDKSATLDGEDVLPGFKMKLSALFR
jgi:Uma2 family endonuclease